MKKEKNIITGPPIRIDQIDDQYIILPKDSVTVKLHVYNYVHVSNFKITWTVFGDPPFTGTITQNDSRLTATFSGFKEVGIYDVQVNVKDDQGNFTSGYFRIIVNSRDMTANAGNDRVLQLPITSLTLTGTYTGGLPPHTFKWEQIRIKHALTIKNGDKENVTLSDFVKGVYEMKFSVTDNAGKTAFDVVQITVKEGLIIDAIASQEITLPINSVKTTINVRNQTGDLDIKWTKMTGPDNFPIKITKDNLSTTFSGFKEAGIYLFEVRVRDGAGNTAVNTFRVIINPEPLRVNAGEDQTITLPINSVTITETVNREIEQITFISWNKITGPDIFYIQQNILYGKISGLIEGTYVFEITVKDIYDQRATDSMSIVVNASAKTEADRKAKEEADRKAKEEADKKAKEEADRKAKEEADRKKRSRYKKNHIWKHNAKGKYQNFYNKKYSFVVEFVSLSDDLNSKIWNHIKWITEAKQFDPILNEFVDKKYITFNKGIFYNSTQSTGVLSFLDKDITPDIEYLWHEVIDHFPEIIRMDKNEKKWITNELRNLRVNYSEPMFNSNIEDLQNYYYIDKIINKKSINFRKDWTECEPLRDTYLMVRLIFEDRDDIKLLLNYSIENTTQSFR